MNFICGKGKNKMGGYTFYQCTKCGKVISEGYEGESMIETPCNCVHEHYKQRERDLERIILSFEELLGSIDEPQCGKKMVKSHIEGEIKNLRKLCNSTREETITEE